MLAFILLAALAATVLLHFPNFVLYGLIAAGGAGACASVFSKVPRLGMRPSDEFETYKGRIPSRIGTGIITSLIASALIGWGVPVPTQNQTFATVLGACTSVPRTSCTEFSMLFLLGVAMGFAFSERLVARFDEPLLRGGLPTGSGAEPFQ